MLFSSFSLSLSLAHIHQPHWLNGESGVKQAKKCFVCLTSIETNLCVASLPRPHAHKEGKCLQSALQPCLTCSESRFSLWLAEAARISIAMAFFSLTLTPCLVLNFNSKSKTPAAATMLQTLMHICSIFFSLVQCGTLHAHFSERTSARHCSQLAFSSFYLANQWNSWQVISNSTFGCNFGVLSGTVFFFSVHTASLRYFTIRITRFAGRQQSHRHGQRQHPKNRI